MRPTVVAGPSSTACFAVGSGSSAAGSLRALVAAGLHPRGFMALCSTPTVWWPTHPCAASKSGEAAAQHIPFRACLEALCPPLLWFKVGLGELVVGVVGMCYKLKGLSGIIAILWRSLQT
jgi:hypothetical protein